MSSDVSTMNNRYAQQLLGVLRIVTALLYIK